MAEYASTALSLTPVPGSWQEILKQISTYLRMRHPPYSAPRDETVLVVVDGSQRKVVEAKPFRRDDPIRGEAAGLEYWRQLTWEISFGVHPALVSVCLRAAQPDETEVVLWFPTRVREAVFSFDPDRKSLDKNAKSDLMRLLIGVAKTLRAAGFGYGFVDDDILLGPPSLDLLREYVEGEFHMPQAGRRLLVAGLSYEQVDDIHFVYDKGTPRLHYRQGGYYLCDRIWPVDAFLDPPKDSEQEDQDD